MSLVEVKIGDLGKVVTGNTPPKKDPSNYDGTYPFIKPTDMDIDKRYVTEWDENYSEKAYKQYHRSYIPPGATGVVTIGTVGEKLFQAHQHCFTNQSVNVIIPNDKYYDDYVFYLMKLNLPKVESANPGTASGRHHVSKSNFCSIKVDVIESIDSQKRIADILSTYDDLIENNLKRIKLLEQAAQNIYKEWFVNLRFPGYENTPINEETGLPVGWEKDFLGNQLASVKRKKKLKKNDYLSNGTYPIIDQSDGYIGGYSEDIEAVQDSPLPLVIFGDHTRRVKYINFPFISGADGTQLLYPKNINLLPAYFYLTVQSIDLSDYAYARHFKYLKQQEIIIPCNSVALEFNNRVYPLLKQSIHLLSYNVKLKAARAILLPRLMNRTIEV